MIIRMVESNNHLIDVPKDVVSQTFSEFYQKRWCKRRFLLITWKTNKKLVVRILCKLFYQFPVGIIVLLLDNK